MDVQLREATPHDAPELAQMNRMLMEDEGALNPMSVEGLTTRMTEWLETGIYKAVIITRDEAIVGYVLYRTETDATDVTNVNIHVRQFFVKRAYRRRGIGRRAFEQVVATHFPPDATIVLEVLAGNLQGQTFWQRLGFEPYFTTYRRRTPTTTQA